MVRPRDYEPGDTIDADSPYAAFFAAKESGAAIEVGDLLEAGEGSLRICKFVGFEEAHWVIPEQKAASPEMNPGGAAEAEASRAEAEVQVE